MWHSILRVWQVVVRVWTVGCDMVLLGVAGLLGVVRCDRVVRVLIGCGMVLLGCGMC